MFTNNKIFIPFNKPNIVGNELKYIKQAVKSGKISGDGIFTKKCHKFLENRYQAKKVLLTTSGTAALEMAAILCNIKPGDEVIMPSFTFVSTANAFVLRGAKIRFVDIREDTLNIDENKIEEKISNKTKAIVVVHYGGVSCEMDKILQIAKKYNLFVIEDAAHAIESKYKKSYLGTIGDIGCYSFHETKNVICGEGGAILLNNESFFERAEIIREKGTDRSKFFRGEVDKYTWVDIGSSYLPSEILSAFLYAQLEKINQITNKRLKIWNNYHLSFKFLEEKNIIRRPVIPENCTHNGHMYYIILNTQSERDKLMKYLKKNGILSVFHYLPLHLSPMYLKLENTNNDSNFSNDTLKNTIDLSSRLLRLPLYYTIKDSEVNFIIKKIYNHLL